MVAFKRRGAVWGEVVTCEYQSEPNCIGKKKCQHPEKNIVWQYCENICKFKKCPLGVVNP